MKISKRAGVTASKSDYDVAGGGLEHLILTQGICHVFVVFKVTIVSLVLFFSI